MTENEAKILLCQMYLPQFDEEEKQALSMAIQALEELHNLKERNNPKKVVKCDTSHKCPICNHWVGFRYGYCDNCGQALDWQ